MTKAELLEFLEPFSDNIEIFVASRQGRTHLSRVYSVGGASYHLHSDFTGEIWLEQVIIEETE